MCFAYDFLNMLTSLVTSLNKHIGCCAFLNNKPCNSHTGLKPKKHNFEKGSQIQVKTTVALDAQPCPYLPSKVVKGLLLGTFIPPHRSQDYGSSKQLPQTNLYFLPKM